MQHKDLKLIDLIKDAKVIVAIFARWKIRKGLCVARFRSVTDSPIASLRKSAHTFKW